MTPPASPSPSVAILADDLIWSTRLAGHVAAAGGLATAVRDLAALIGVLPRSDAAIVDLTARAYDGIAAVKAATRGGCRVLAVGQHDDAALRRAALEAGAERVYAYRKLFEDGPATLARWLGTEAAMTSRGREGARP